jgi:hypothetical protein
MTATAEKSIRTATAQGTKAVFLYEAATEVLKAAQIGGRLPNVAALQTEYKKLQEDTMYTDYGKLNDKQKKRTGRGGHS